MDSDIKRQPQPDPLPSKKTELMGARQAIVEMYLKRHLDAINAEMGMAFEGLQNAEELGHAIEVMTDVYAQRIVKALYK